MENRLDITRQLLTSELSRRSMHPSAQIIILDIRHEAIINTYIVTISIIIIRLAQLFPQ